MPMNLIVFPIGGGGGGPVGSGGIGDVTTAGRLSTGGGGGGGFGWNRNGFRSISDGAGDGFFSCLESYVQICGVHLAGALGSSWPGADRGS